MELGGEGEGQFLCRSCILHFMFSNTKSVLESFEWFQVPTREKQGEWKGSSSLHTTQKEGYIYI